MNFIVDNWYLFAVALVSGALLFWPMLKAGAASGVTTAEAVRLVNREKALMIDVSEPAEYAAGHVSGARSVPLSRLQSAVGDLPKNKALPLVVSGTGAAKAVPILKKMGFENASSLAGGLAAWRAANLPVDKSA